jgi:hypothetical protein
MQACPKCAEARAEHLDFVVMKRLMQRHALTRHGDQIARELAGVSQRAVGPRAIGWHDMDGVAEQGDIARLPVLDRNGTTHSEEKGLLPLGRRLIAPFLRRIDQIPRPASFRQKRNGYTSVEPGSSKIMKCYP